MNDNLESLARLPLAGFDQGLNRNGEATAPASGEQCDLPDPICDVHRVASAEQAKNVERPRRLMAVRTLQQQNRAMVGEAVDVARQRLKRR